jgi:broad specificity phosphatase PhoE
MTTVLLVRHGQTAWNGQERFRGQIDLPLNDTGLQQAEAVAQRIAQSWEPDAIYASSLQRALQTAAPIARACGLRTTIHDGLLDIDYGDFGGLTPEEAVHQYPDLARAWRRSPQAVQFPAGESLAEVRSRAETSVREIVAGHPHQIVVLVTHVVVCRLLLCGLLGLDNDHFWQFEPVTASLSIFEISEGGGVLRSFNDTCHLSA